MNLIANTGIQFFNFQIGVNYEDSFKMYFHEWRDTDSKEQQVKLEIAHSFSEEVWVRKIDLVQLGYLENGHVKLNWEDIEEDFLENSRSLISIDPYNPKDSGCFYLSLSKINWSKFENCWLPLPYFSLKGKNSDFGPTNWCRFKLIPCNSPSDKRRYEILLAFDTRSTFEDEEFNEEDLKEWPVFTSNFDRSKTFALCNNDSKLMSFFSKEYNCEWVNNYLLKHFHDIKDINQYKGPKPVLEYLAQYIFLVRYIQQQDILPEVTLFSNKKNSIAYGNVDLVIDIGNSRTCAVLFDDGKFDKSSPLELQDYTIPILNGTLNKYRDSFDMRLAFRHADFGGTFGIDNSQQFIYPSLIRLGKEANYLIHKASNLNTNEEKTSTFSSAKRFLWDNKPQKQEWENVRLEGEAFKPMYIRGISEQLNSDGSLNPKGNGSILSKYSRKALMTFSFLEILSQAKTQINSYEQRKHWGNETTPREIGRIIITCPTAMSKVEQVNLRRCAEDAAIVLDRFYENKFDTEINEREARLKTQVIPPPKKLLNTENRAEWIYDEATSAQFVFLYAEIRERYLKNAKDYFNLYGKIREDIDPNNKTLTIGSVDIGAGTTDLMIASYKHDSSKGQCALTPVPLFWESFYKAGDDLMKELVHQLVVEGKHSPIEKRLRDIGKNPIEIMQPFLGTNNGVSVTDRQLRSDFNLQISVPIILHYLELLKQGEIESKILLYSDIFNQNPPTRTILSHFESTFGFKFETLQWQYEMKVIASIVEKIFDTLVGKISSLLSYYECDIVLLSGRPTSLRPLTDLFLKYYAISPNRLKTMNDYRVGRWYPQDNRYRFINGNGNFTNPKSIITTGAMIANIAEKGSLHGFSLNLEELKKKLISTTNFFGILNDQLEFNQTIISPQINKTTVEIQELPLRIGVRQLDIKSYPTRPFYIFDFNEFALEDRIKGRLDEEHEDDMNLIQTGVKAEKDKILLNLPLSVSIYRDKSEDMELLRLDEIVDRNGNKLPTGFFNLQVQSMSEIENFWLDSGIFSLNLNITQK